jgi:hypothetical protein
LYVFFWLFPRRQVKFFRRFETLCRVHLQRLDEEYSSSLWKQENVQEQDIFLDFKFSPCFESCMFSFGYFPGVRLSFADISEPSVRSIFKGVMKNIHHAFENKKTYKKKIYFFPAKRPDHLLGQHKSPNQRVVGADFQGIKRLGQNPGSSLPPNYEV